MVVNMCNEFRGMVVYVVHVIAGQWKVHAITVLRRWRRSEIYLDDSYPSDHGDCSAWQFVNYLVFGIWLLIVYSYTSLPDTNFLLTFHRRVLSIRLPEGHNGVAWGIQYILNTPVVRLNGPTKWNHGIWWC